MSFFQTLDGNEIYYERVGSGKPIIFIHGFTENSSIFRIQSKFLSSKYEIIAYDLRGHGKSSNHIEVTAEILARDLKELITYLKLKNVNLVGWSMGVSIILEYINLFGEENLEKIVLVDKSPKDINDNDWKLGLNLGEYTKDNLEESLNMILNNWEVFIERFIKKLAIKFSDNQIKNSINRVINNDIKAMYQIWRSIVQKDYRDMLDIITIPTLLVFGGKSTLYSVDVGEYMKEKIKASKLIIFPEDTHLLVIENPKKFNQIIEEFI